MGSSQASPANLEPLCNNRLNIVNNFPADYIWPIGVTISNCWLKQFSVGTADKFDLLCIRIDQPGSDWQKIWFQNLVFTANITVYKFTYYWICTCFPRLQT